LPLLDFTKVLRWGPNEDLAGCSNVLGDSCIVFTTCLLRRKRFVHDLREFPAGYQRDADAHTRHRAFAFTHANTNRERHSDQ